MGSAIGKHCSSSSCSLAMENAFLLDGHTARFLSRERKWGSVVLRRTRRISPAA
jgi:hypothetical protein